jgi:hypothetical protein
VDFIDFITSGSAGEGELLWIRRAEIEIFSALSLVVPRRRME